MDPDAPAPGVLHYVWGLLGGGGATAPLPDSSFVTISWQTLSTTYGFSKGVTAQTYTLGLLVYDNNGTSTSVITTVTLAANQPPVADAGGDTNGEYHFQYGGSVTLTGNANDPDMYDNPTYEWDIGNDGTVDSISAIKTLDWPALYALSIPVGGSLPVKLTVNDGLASSTVIVDLVYDNTAPSAFASPLGGGTGAYEIYKDEDLNLDASWSSDDDHGPSSLTFSWDVNGDDVFGDESGETVNLSWSDLVGYGYSAPSTHTIKVKVSDGQLESIASATVIVKLPEVSLTFTDDCMAERTVGSDDGVLQIMRTGPTTNALSGTIVIPTSVAGVGNLATNGSDYTVTSLSWTIPAGDSSVDIVFTTVNETTKAASNVEGTEVVIVNLGASSDYTGVSTSAQASIYDNDKWDWITPVGSGLSKTSFYGWGSPNYDWMQAYMQVQAASNSSVSAHVDGVFWDNSFLGSTSTAYSVSQDLKFDFQIDATTGVITGSTTPSAPSSGSRTDGPLSCGIGYSTPLINNVSHTVVVSFGSISVIAGGTVSLGGSVPIGGGVGLTVSATQSWAHEFAEPAVMITLVADIVEEDLM